jgi:activating signal cointegrator complex subunit 3
MAADTLDDHKMIRYDPGSGNLAATDLGRSASHFYIKHESVYRFNGAMKVCGVQLLMLVPVKWYTTA